MNIRLGTQWIGSQIIFSTEFRKLQTKNKLNTTRMSTKKETNDHDKYVTRPNFHFEVLTLFFCELFFLNSASKHTHTQLTKYYKVFTRHIQNVAIDLFSRDCVILHFLFIFLFSRIFSHIDHLFSVMLHVFIHINV